MRAIVGMKTFFLSSSLSFHPHSRIQINKVFVPPKNLFMTPQSRYPGAGPANHPGCIDKFESKLQSNASQKSATTAFTGVGKSAVYASHIVAYQTAKVKKPHAIGEYLLSL